MESKKNKINKKLFEIVKLLKNIQSTNRGIEWQID